MYTHTQELIYIYGTLHVYIDAPTQEYEGRSDTLLVSRLRVVSARKYLEITRFWLNNSLEGCDLGAHFLCFAVSVCVSLIDVSEQAGI